MGQRLRVVGWLRFGSKAQLTKGLRAFAENEAPGYYEADSWSVEGLDARIRLDVELPGDFTDVERPFLAMSWASAYGYIDYFEDGNEKIHGGPRNGPLKRWNTGALNRRLKWASPYGTSGLAYPRGDVILTVSGRLQFDTASAAEKALGSLPLRLPYLEAEGVRELRLGEDVVRREGGEIAIEAAIEAPVQVVEPLNEVWRMLAAKAKTGKITLREPRWTSSVAAGTKKIERASLREKPVAGGAAPLRPVDASTPIAGAAEAPPAEATIPGKRPAPKVAALDDVPLEGHPGGVAGAALLPGGRLAVWGGRSLSFFEGDLARPYTCSLATEIDGKFSWPVNGVVGLGADRALVFHEMNGAIEIVDLARREVRRVAAHGHSVFGALVVDAHVLTWSLDGTVRVANHDGDALHVCRVVEAHGGGVDRVIALADGTFVAVGKGRAGRWDLRSGAQVEDLGERTDVHALSAGRYLLERHGVFELRGPGAPRAFTADAGNSHHVTQVSDDEILFHARSQRGFTILSLRDGAERTIDTGSTKPLGAVVRLDERLWMSHARSMPGLNERFGFDGKARVWEQGSWKEIGTHETKVPIREIVPIGDGGAALLLDDAVRGKEVPIYDARRRRLTGTIKGARKSVSGVLSLPEGRILIWSKDGRARVVRV